MYIIVILMRGAAKSAQAVAQPPVRNHNLF